MLLPVLEKKGVANFSGDEANWKIRHIWGQLGGLCEEEPGLTAVPSTAARSQTPGHDVTIGALPASGTTGCVCWDRVAQAAASSRWLCPPSPGKAASPLPGLEAAVPSSSVHACPHGFGCLFPRCLPLAGSSGLLQQLKDWNKMEGRHPVYRQGEKQM